MDMNEMEKQLETLKQANRKKETDLRKQIEKRKRQEKDALVKAVGELAIKSFPKCKTVDEYDAFFKFIISKKDVLNSKPAQAKPQA